MTRRVFYSFHYSNDNWRASQVRNIGSVEGNKPATDNDWEAVKRGGDEAIKRWINGQMNGKSAVVVLVGEKTAGRKWIKHEIKKAWESGKGLIGICIHNLKDGSGNQSREGRNPFEDITLNGKKLSTIVSLKNPPYLGSQTVYNYIGENLERWIKEAVETRNEFA